MTSLEKFKDVYSQFQNNSSKATVPPEFSSNDFVFPDRYTILCRTEAYFTDPKDSKTTQPRLVWIDWLQIVEPGKEEYDSMSRHAALLAHSAKPKELRTLTCIGYFVHPPSGEQYPWKIGFVYDGSMPATLSDLWRPERELRCDGRGELGLLIAKSVLDLHSVGWVHRDLSSRNILITEDTLFLSGFDYAHPHVSRTYLYHISPHAFPSRRDWFRHPQLQFDYPHQDHQKKHDVYSLGILMLEIALWKPLQAIIDMDQWPLNNDMQSIKSVQRELQKRMPKLWKLVAKSTSREYADVVNICCHIHERSDLAKFHKAIDDLPKSSARRAKYFLTDIIKYRKITVSLDHSFYYLMIES